MSDALWTPTESSEYALDFVDPDNAWAAHVKWDGCVDLTRYFNGTLPTDPEPSEVDTLHICDLTEFIERLTALRDLVAIKAPLVGW